jgi:hypothetical protein
MLPAGKQSDRTDTVNCLYGNSLYFQYREGGSRSVEPCHAPCIEVGNFAPTQLAVAPVRGAGVNAGAAQTARL